MSGNAHLAASVISTAIKLGAVDFVICAGARNVPLINDLSSRSEIQLWNHFDERSAAFFALGLAKRRQNPVAIVTTSGTAVAELLPATIEAWYSGIPLILLTADRPKSFRGSGAPQAIEQADIFQGYVGCSLDLSSSNGEIYWDKKSPLHLNVCFEEPVAEEPASAPPLKITYPETEPLPCQIGDLQNPVAIIGELAETDRPMVEDFLAGSGIPTWFEATSGLRESSRLKDQRIAHESEISKIVPAEIIRIGGVPSLRFWRDLETNSEIRVCNFSRKQFPGLARKENVSTREFTALPDCTRYTSKPYQVHSNIVPGTLARHPRSESALVAALSRIIPETASVFLGNSLPIREWNQAADFSRPHPHCFANRGANGIDGEVSTFLGISREFEESWGIFGDLTALYDLNAPWIVPQLSAGKRRIVVLNNSGGRIFSRLPAMRNLDPEIMTKTENHHDVHFAAWAELWGMDYVSWSDQPNEWDLPDTDHLIIEIRIDQQNSEAFWAEFNK